MQRDILKYHVHGNRVIALQGFIRSSELLSSRNAPRTYEDFERERDRRSMAGLPARLESTTKVLTTNHRSARFLAFRSASGKIPFKSHSLPIGQFQTISAGR